MGSDYVGKLLSTADALGRENSGWAGDSVMVPGIGKRIRLATTPQ
jgi:hypothetical protein